VSHHSSGGRRPRRHPKTCGAIKCIKARRAQPPTINSAVSALRFFFRVTLNRPEMCRHLTMVRQSQKLPTVLSKEEVLQLLEAAPGVKYKAALSVAYGAGLRVSEVANLKVSDIDSKRMLIRVEQGKGKKDRHAMLSPQLLAILQDYWWVARPRVWLFPGRDPLLPITTRQLYRVVQAWLLGLEGCAEFDQLILSRLSCGALLASVNF
jgi:integrase/recombinase XerD